MTANGGTGSGINFITTDGTLNSQLDLYYDTYVIPEPSTFVLLGLAGLAALFLRRRK